MVTITESSSQRIWVIPSVVPPRFFFVRFCPANPSSEKSAKDALPSSAASAAKFSVTMRLSSLYLEGSERSALRLANQYVLGYEYMTLYPSTTETRSDLAPRPTSRHGAAVGGRRSKATPRTPPAKPSQWT